MTFHVKLIFCIYFKVFKDRPYVVFILHGNGGLDHAYRCGADGGDRKVNVNVTDIDPLTSNVVVRTKCCLSMSFQQRNDIPGEIF